MSPRSLGLETRPVKVCRPDAGACCVAERLVRVIRWATKVQISNLVVSSTAARRQYRIACARSSSPKHVPYPWPCFARHYSAETSHSLSGRGTATCQEIQSSVRTGSLGITRSEQGREQTQIRVRNLCMLYVRTIRCHAEECCWLSHQIHSAA